MSCTAQISLGERSPARTERDPSGLAIMLPWDTEFFGFRVGRVKGDTLEDAQAAQVNAWCRAEGIRCLYFLARSDSPITIRNAQYHGFNLVDLRLTLERKVEQASRLPPPGSGAIRPACPHDVPAVQTIARPEHRDTRFFSDPHFPQRLAQELYATWIKLECEGRAQQVFVAAPGTNSPGSGTSPESASRATLDGSLASPVGYISCHFDAGRRTGQIGLIAVSGEFQGKGLGRALVQRALDWFAAQGAQSVSVVTQGRNIPAQRLYQGCGFASASMQLWFHKWFPHDE